MSRDQPSNVTSMATARGTVVETGQDVVLQIPRKRRRRRGWRDHVSMVDVGVLGRLELSTLEYRLLFALLAGVPEKGGIESRVSNAELAATLGVPAPSVSRSMKALRERQLVHTVRPGLHEVNPWVAYNGDFDAWGADTEKWPEPVWVRGADVTTGEVK